MSKHTPGSCDCGSEPWSPGLHVKGCSAVPQSQPRCTCFYHDRDNPNCPDCYSPEYKAAIEADRAAAAKRAADARLIAAAPEMLEELRALLHWKKQVCHGFHYEGEERARALLARVDGGGK